MFPPPASSRLTASPLPLALLCRLMRPNETQFSHPNGQRLQFSKPNIFEVDLHDDSIRSRCDPWCTDYCHPGALTPIAFLSYLKKGFGRPPPSLESVSGIRTTPLDTFNTPTGRFWQLLRCVRHQVFCFGATFPAELCGGSSMPFSPCLLSVHSFDLSSKTRQYSPPHASRARMFSDTKPSKQ